MEITYYKIILIFITSFIIGMESILDQFQIHRPLIACTLIGLVLGDIKQGIIIGGTLEMISLGWMNVGAAISPDCALSSIISTILVISGKQTIGSGIALSIPLAAAGQILTIIVRSLTIWFQHFADKIVEENKNLFYISFLHINALILHAMRISIPSTLFYMYVGNTTIQKIFDLIPVFITNGLNIAGGIIVVVGYAMVINMMKTEYLMPFFYLGFIISGFTKFNLLSFGLLGIIFAIIYIQLSPKYNNNINVIENINKKKDDELD